MLYDTIYMHVVKQVPVFIIMLYQTGYNNIRPAFFYFSFYEAAEPVSGTSEKKKICLHDFFFISYHVIFIFEKKKKKKYCIPYHNFRENLNKNIILIWVFIISDVGLTSIQIKSKSILIQKRYRFANNTFPVNP